MRLHERLETFLDTLASLPGAMATHSDLQGRVPDFPKDIPPTMVNFHEKNLKFITLGNTRNDLVSCLYENRILTR